jgi:DNA-binding winged helix-turn-helix (wHTH) protein
MAEAAHVARFGPFEANLRTGELWRSGERVPLQELPFKVLATLIERRGELVTREELRATTWSGSVYVDFEHGLNKAVNKIRQALGDDPDAPRYVETLPRRGYRFVAPLELGPAAAAPRPSYRLLWDGRTISIGDGENVLGRQPEVTVWIDSYTVSRRHARILVSGGRAILEDLGSKNGTFRCGRRISAPEELADGDEIAVGSARMTFHSSTGAESTRTTPG